MELILSKKEEFLEIYEQMKENFCLDEIRDFELAESIYDEKEYSLYHLCVSGEKVGFVAIWAFDEFAFVEHFVVYANYRNKGFGAQAINLVKEKFGTVLLEVEPPQDETATRRVGFYKRQGFCENEYAYMQPSYRENGNEVKLILMSAPRALKNVERAVEILYKTVYKKDGTS